jgi:hypothetical protein
LLMEIKHLLYWSSIFEQSPPAFLWTDGTQIQTDCANTLVDGLLQFSINGCRAFFTPWIDETTSSAAANAM